MKKITLAALAVATVATAASASVYFVDLPWVSAELSDGTFVDMVDIPGAANVSPAQWYDCNVNNENLAMRAYEHCLINSYNYDGAEFSYMNTDGRFYTHASDFKYGNI